MREMPSLCTAVKVLYYLYLDFDLVTTQSSLAFHCIAVFGSSLVPLDVFEKLATLKTSVS